MKFKSKSLIPEQPLLVLPSLAKKIGLNEAIVLQQLHYWLSSSEHIYGGRRWVYNSYGEWQRQFPFWSTYTIKRIFLGLGKRSLVLTGNFNRLPMDKTKWYTIDYEKVPQIEVNAIDTSQPDGVKAHDDESNMPQSQAQVAPILPGQLAPSNTIDNQKKTTESVHPLKGGCHTPKAGLASNGKAPDLAIAEVFTDMKSHLQSQNDHDPIPHYGKEGKAIKRMLSRGFTREEIMSCWKEKVAKRGGEFVSMFWVNEDIGKKKSSSDGGISTW